MLSPEAIAHRNAQRKALADYMRGPRATPLIIERHPEYDIEEVLYPTFLGRLRVTARYVVICIAAHAPSCALQIALYRALGVRIASSACISPKVMLDPLHPELITLEEDSCLGIGCRLLTHEYTARTFRIGPIRVGKGSVVGAFALVRSGVTIGRGATIGACSFVNRDVADEETVAGVPARPIATRQAESA